MHNLIARVTSRLLPFPDVTIDTLSDNEITQVSLLHGKFTVGRSGLAWLAHGPHLEVVHAVTGERLSAYCFSGGAEHPPSVTAARDFSWLKRSGLLVGLEEAEGSVLCLYDLGLSRVVKAVAIPGRITAIEPLVSYGGASTSTQHLHQSLRWFFGIAAVITDLGHVLLVDLCLDDLSCSQSELEASDLQVITKSPADIPRLREVTSREGRHLCLQLKGHTEIQATALQYISRTNHLAVGFSDGYLQLWNMKTLKKEYHSQLEGGRVPIHAFTFQEPENDPRNCCYLWAVQSAQDLEGDVVSLHLLQLAFSERKVLISGKIMYEGLEYCEERYSQELTGTAFPLRAQANNIHLLSCQTIEKFRPHLDRDDSMNEAASPDTSVSIFSWQVKAYGQGSPSTFIGVFDINRWYHAQMPDSLRIGESLQNCPYLAVWSLEPLVQAASSHLVLDVLVHERSLSRGLPISCPPPEQYFNSTTYNFDAVCLLNSGILHLTCPGYQKESLSFLKKAAPCSSDVISASYSRCLMSGLLTSRLADNQSSSISQEEQLDAILSTAVETSSLGLITGCIKQWTAEEQPGSALNLRYILDWAWNKVVHTKEELDGICAPLFDSSSNFIDPQTMQLLQHSQRLLGNLSIIFHCLLTEAQELTEKGLVGLKNRDMVSSLISKYAQVVLWFCRTGLLPEGSDEDALKISRPFYTHSVISSYYDIRREELTRLAKGRWCADCLMIDGLVGECGERLANLWKRDEGGTGQYPPPTLHALLDIHLLDNIEESAKHAIVIYLLLDVMYSFPNKDGTSVESFPTAFAIPIGLVKLVQGLWLLDHNDHQRSFELLLHPAASQCHFEWQHYRVLQALMCQGQHSRALRYFHITKPPVSSTSQAKLCLSVLLHNRCLIEAWSFLRQNSNHLNVAELLNFLYESCQELSLISELLKLPLGEPEQEFLEKFFQGSGGLQNRELLMVHYLQQSKYIPALQLNHNLKMNLVNERDPKLKERSITRNAILDQYGKILPRIQRKLAVERAKPYQHPNTVHKEVPRPVPLSTVAKRFTSDNIMSRARFINNVLAKIEEVWSSKGASPQSSPAESCKAGDIQSSSPKPSSMGVSDPFLGTPITMSTKRKSRLVDLVVLPSSQTPLPFLSPARPPSSWVSPKSINKAPELSLLQTPQIVKRARALAASGPGFSAVTLQSILRSSLRPTPVATPSASPGRSITPPLCSKDSRITFFKETEASEFEKGIRWANGMAGDNEMNIMALSSPIAKSRCKPWSSQPAEEVEDEDDKEHHVKFLPPEDRFFSPQLGGSESEFSSAQDVSTENRSPGLEMEGTTREKISLALETSQVSIRSTDTTLEFYDAPLSVEWGKETGTVTTEKDDYRPPSDEPQETVTLCNEHTTRDAVSDGQLKEAETSQEMGHGLEQEAKKDEAHLGSVLVNESTEFDTEVGVKHPLEDVEQRGQTVGTEFQETSEDQESSAAAELSEEPPEAMEQTADLTEFVQRHLFCSDMSPLTRSGIHSASFNRSTAESVIVVEEEEQGATEGSPVFSSQRSASSATSYERTGTDSHSVMSVNHSEDAFSSPLEEQEEDQEEDEDSESVTPDEEEEDSGSEVEIIKEVQGNTGMSPLHSSPVFGHQRRPNILPAVSEQEAVTFSLPHSEPMKIETEELEGEVVMVRLGVDGGIEINEEEEQQSSYVELKPSNTVLMPLELVEHSLVDDPQMSIPELEQINDPHVQSSFSLVIDKDEDEEADTLPMDDDLQSSTHNIHPVAAEATEESDSKPGETDLGTAEQNSPLTGDVSWEEQKNGLITPDKTEVDGLTEVESVKPQTEVQTQVPKLLESSNGENDGETEVVDEDHSGYTNEPLTVSYPGSVEVEEGPSLPDNKEEINIVGNGTTTEDTSVTEIVEEVGNRPTTSAEEQEEPKVNQLNEVKSEITHITTAVEGKKQDEKILTENDGGDDDDDDDRQNEIKDDKKMTVRVKSDTEQEAPVKPASRQPEQESVSEFPPSRKKKAPPTPTRRSTRGKTVSFMASVQQNTEISEDNESVNVTESSALVPGSKGYVTRSRKQSQKTKVQVSTPRRSSRNTQLTPHKVDNNETCDQDRPMDTDKKSSAAAKTHISTRATPTRRSQRCQGDDVQQSVPIDLATEEQKQQDIDAMDVTAAQTSSKAPPPAKLRTPERTPPRRSSRCTSSIINQVLPATLESLMEEESEEEVAASDKHSSRKIKLEPSDGQAVTGAPIKQQPSYSGRVTRHSRHLTLNVYPKAVGEKKDEAVHDDQRDEPKRRKDAGDSKLPPLNRSKLWDHYEEDLPLLDSPLEVDSETPVADALIKRLQDEKENHEGKSVTKTRDRKKRAKSSVEQDHTLPPVKVLKPEEYNMDEHSYIYSPSRRTTRAQRKDSLIQAEGPLTRRQVAKATARQEVASVEDNVDVEKETAVLPVRKTARRTTKSKEVSDPPPVAEVDLISPLPSPADPAPRSQRRHKEGEVAPSRMTLRRRRIMDTVFTKPVTRRKKL